MVAKRRLRVAVFTTSYPRHRDVFGTAFFALTRYEEAVKGERDSHGRFPASAAAVPDRPIVNELVELLWDALRREFPRLERREHRFEIVPSHDVDIPRCPARSVRGVAVDVVSPGAYSDFGLAFDGGGIMRNIRRRPWLAPLLFLSMVWALRRAARRADLVHAHWLAGAVVALFAGKPFVVTIHGSISGGFLDDFRLCERHPRLVRLVLSRARVVLCVSGLLC